MPTYRNERNGDVVTVTGANADRLDSLDNWVKVKPERKAKEADSQKATTGPVPAGPADAGIGEPNGNETTAAEVADNATETPEELKGQALDDALEAAGLPKTGTADEKRARLAEGA